MWQPIRRYSSSRAELIGISLEAAKDLAAQRLHDRAMRSTKFLFCFYHFDGDRIPEATVVE